MYNPIFDNSVFVSVIESRRWSVAYDCGEEL